MAKPFRQRRAQMSPDAQAQAAAKAQALLADLEAEGVAHLLTRHPVLRAVLEECQAALQACFGAHRTTLEVLHDGEDGPLLRLRVHLPVGRAHDAQAALARFDASWWLAHCHRTEALLVIDSALETPLA